MDSEGRANAEKMGLRVVTLKNGRVIIVDSKLSEESINKIIAKAQKGLGPAVNKTIWQVQKEEITTTH